MGSQTPQPRATAEDGTPAWDFRRAEEKWRMRWADAQCFAAPDRPIGEAFYNFDGGPFPNGSLHIGHARAYTLGDVMARYQRMRGRSVLYSFEFDAFGLPVELAAEARNTHPWLLARQNIRAVGDQMRRLGLSYSWRHVHSTCDPKYYKWTQWLFLELRERGLVYRAPATLNWCPHCGTTLAFMQVVGGTCWRCGEPVVQRRLTQWFVRLEAYSNVLYRTLSHLDGWSPRIRHLLAGFLGPHSVYTAQFKPSTPQVDSVLIAEADRPDALAHATFLFCSPQYKQLDEILEIAPRRDAARALLDSYMDRPRVRIRRGQPRLDSEDLQGTATGIMVEHPLTGLRMPVFLVLWSDSQRLEIGVPSLDPQHARFAAAAGLPRSEGRASSGDLGSEESGVTCSERYRVHDWLVSRQRKWGTPIPVIYCDRCGCIDVPRDDLPVLLPIKEMEEHPTRPLHELPSFSRAPCPRCGKDAVRDGDTLDCYFDVVWCYLACATTLGSDFAFRAADFPWLPVDWYHNGYDSFLYPHLYRFLGRVLHEAGILDDQEPIRRHHGHDMVLSGDEKVAKRRGSDSLDQMLDHWGADALRVALLWAARPAKPIHWGVHHIVRAVGLLNLAWRLLSSQAGTTGRAGLEPLAELPEVAGSLRRVVGNVTRFVESYRYNAALDEIYRFLRGAEALFDTSQDSSSKADGGVASAAASVVIRLLAPFAPHLAEELWEQQGGEGLVSCATWPNLPTDGS